jgi:HK97 family phage major capsid protein
LSDNTYVQRLLDERARAWEQAKEILDRASDEKRERTAEEETMYQRANDDIVRLGKQVDEWLDSNRIERELSTAREAVEGLVRPEVATARNGRVVSQVENWFRDQARAEKGLPTEGAPMAAFELDLKPSANLFRAIRMGMDAKEARAIYTDGGASAGSLVVPVEFVNQLYQFIEASSAIRRISRVITTNSGEPMTFPRVATHGVGTQVVAQGTAIGGTDPVFGTMRLDAYKYGQLVKVSTEAAADTGFDLLGFIAENIGRAVGRVTDTAYVTGSGTGAPNGIITAASVGATTGGSLIALGAGAAATFTGNLDSLIRLQHSVVDEYRINGSYVMNDSTAGTVRQVKDGGNGTIGAYIWTPATTFDSVTGLRQPDRLFGAPVYTDTNFGTNGSSVKPVAYGDFSAYYIRDSGSFRFERSNERYFDTDEIGFRGVLRTDADLIDTGAVKVLQQAV